MNSARLARKVTLLVGGSAIIAMGALTAGCSSTKEEPKTTPSASSSPAVSPTEKAAGGPNSFSPTVNPGPGGGSSCSKIVNGVCSR